MPFSPLATRLALTLALLATGALAGCNLFDPLQTESDNPAVLVDDARDARAAGNLDRAVELLERALTREPSNPVVRFELSSTLTQRARVSMLDLETIFAYFDEAFGSGTAARPEPGQVCTFAEGTPTSPFNPNEIGNYATLVAAYPALARVIELMNDPNSPTEAPAMPEAFTALTPCSAIVDGEIVYDRVAVYQALSDQFGTDEMVTGALSVTATAHVLAAYVALFEQADLPIGWFVTEDDRLGGCVAEAHYDLLIERAQAQVNRVGTALVALDLLLYHTGNAEYQALIDDALQYYDAFAESDFYPCG